MERNVEQYVSRVKEDFKQKELDYLGLTPDDDQHAQIVKYFCMLYDGIERKEILSGSNTEDIFVRFFCDSLQPLLLFGFGRDSSLLDIKSEAGFPSIPTAIFRPDMDVTVWAEGVHEDFLHDVVEYCGLENVQVVSKAPGRKKFDYVVQRSNATLQELTREARSRLKSDGRIYSFMTDKFHSELSEITMNKEEEGVSVVEIIDYDIAGKVDDLNLVAFELYK
ncbi:MAG: RsmG family class I SAM-dependent methyltransferase [Fibrobacterota bacterium]